MSDYIVLENVSKEYKDKLVFRNVSLKLQRGGCYAFTGYNGCGKSVLMKIICGFAAPTSGKITIDGKVLGEDVEFIEDAGISINAPDFMNELTGFENLKILAGIQNKITEKDIKKTVHKLKLDEFIDKKVKVYSLGNKQRLRIAQAIMENPQILILDEPMNALDKSGIKIVREIMQQHLKKGGTIIFTSHNAEDLDALNATIFEFDDYELHQIN